MKHRLRGADSIHLAAAMFFRDAVAEPIGMIASDAELLRAASAEGFTIYDPQLDSPMPAPATP